MTSIKLYNTLTRKKELFKPIKKGQVGMYQCGPTVYWYQHIGNLRTALLNDLLKRMFLYNGFKVNHVMNITDVDDKTIKASLKEKVSLKDLTRKYEKIYFDDLKKLNIIKPSLTPRATESIQEMIDIISKLIEKGYAYEASDGVYYSINKFKNYGKLAGLNKIEKAKSRIKGDEYDKENLHDFSLWKFHTKEDGPNSWKAPFGEGRPGWHIECSAMSTSNLGKTIDIHTGGTDLVFPHHTNEIAQSEACTGKKFVNYWVHGAFLNLKKGKMSKSKGEILTLEYITSQGYSPVYLRYLMLMTHYRKQLEFSLETLDAAKNAYEKIKKKILEIKKQEHKGKDLSKQYQESFLEAINDDLNMPKALSIFMKVLEDSIFSPKEKIKTLEKFDEVLGLGIKDLKEEKISIPKEIKDLANEREKARSEKNWAKADELRDKIKEKGYALEDSSEGPIMRPL